MSKPRYCQVAADLDSHPKIRKAGRLGREVFLFALRRNAKGDGPVTGALPGDVLEPWFVSDQLMMTEAEACAGLEACVKANLLRRDGEAWTIVGWESHWGYQARTGAERQAKYKAKLRDDASGDGVTSPNVTVTKSDAIEETRLEEKRVGNASHSARARRKSPELPIPVDWRPTDKHRQLATERQVDVAVQAQTFRAHAETHDRRCVRWDAAFTQWLLKSDPDRRRLPNGSHNPSPTRVALAELARLEREEITGGEP